AQAEFMGIQRTGNTDGNIVDQDLAGTGRVDACQDLDQRRLARPVLPQQTMDLSPKEPEVDALEHLRPAEFLLQSTNFNQCFGVHDCAQMNLRWISSRLSMALAPTARIRIRPEKS